MNIALDNINVSYNDDGSTTVKLCSGGRLKVLHVTGRNMLEQVAKICLMAWIDNELTQSPF